MRGPGGVRHRVRWRTAGSGSARTTASCASIRGLRATRVFHEAHGLQAEDFNFNAHLRAGDGTLFFGGNNGFNAFAPTMRLPRCAAAACGAHIARHSQSRHSVAERVAGRAAAARAGVQRPARDVRVRGARFHLAREQSLHRIGSKGSIPVGSTRAGCGERRTRISTPATTCSACARRTPMASGTTQGLAIPVRRRRRALEHVDGARALRGARVCSSSATSGTCSADASREERRKPRAGRDGGACVRTS